ncbi:MAG: radical SAM protein [Candidatus Omnitrophota bacterium]|jgi:DNA repair photolyase
MPLITPFDPWKSKYCTCPAKYSFSAYTGCGHGCLYCYASSYIRNFSQPRPKKELLKRLEMSFTPSFRSGVIRTSIFSAPYEAWKNNVLIKKIPKNSTITIANSSDPYQALEEKLQLTRKTLIILKDFDGRLNIVTKSALITRDIDVFREFKNVTVSFTLTSLDEKIAKRIEPFLNYTPKEKLEAISALSKNIPVAVRFDPLIYPLNTKDIKKVIRALKKSGVKQIITSTYKAKPDNLKRMNKAFPEYAKLWETLYLKTGEKIGGYNYLPLTLRIKMIEEVREITLSLGLEFSSCREGLSELNTAICDGTSLIV